MKQRVTSILALALVTALAFGSAVNAQDNGAGADQQQTKQLMQEYRQKASKLQKIHKETVKANPDLAAQQKQFTNRVRQTVEDQGYDIDKGQQRVQDLAQKLQSGDLSDSERKAVMQDFQAERQQMMQARQKALQKPEIKSAGEKLQKDTLAAMKQHDSETQKLLDEMDSLRSKLQSQMPAGPGNG